MKTQPKKGEPMSTVATPEFSRIGAGTPAVDERYSVYLQSNHPRFPGSVFITTFDTRTEEVVHCVDLPKETFRKLAQVSLGLVDPLEQLWEIS